MSLQVTTNINVDFYDKKYILINAKQLDKNSRFLSVTCYNRAGTYQSGEQRSQIYSDWIEHPDYGNPARKYG